MFLYCFYRSSFTFDVYSRKFGRSSKSVHFEYLQFKNVIGKKFKGFRRHQETLDGTKDSLFVIIFIVIIICNNLGPTSL